mgnify:CR=1 FL=1
MAAYNVDDFPLALRLSCAADRLAEDIWHARTMVWGGLGLTWRTLSEASRQQYRMRAEELLKTLDRRVITEGERE